MARKKDFWHQYEGWLISYIIIQSFITIGCTLGFSDAIIRRNAKVRRDGCLMVLTVLGAFLASFLWPIPAGLGLALLPFLAIYGIFLLFYKICLGEDQRCCGIDFRSVFCGKEKAGNQDEEGGTGVVDRPFDRSEGMELPAYPGGVASRDLNGV